MTLLKFEDLEWGPVGSFNWFATHGTSMSRTNSLISGDNKGAAARFMEDWFKQIGTLEMSKRMHPEFRDRPSSILRRVSSMLPHQQKGLSLLPLWSSVSVWYLLRLFFFLNSPMPGKMVSLSSKAFDAMLRNWSYLYGILYHLYLLLLTLLLCRWANEACIRLSEYWGNVFK